MMKRQQVYLLDAYALIFRAFYAFIKNPITNSKGVDTSAIFGFVLTLQDILEKASPDMIAVAFDPAGGTFRHKEFPEYKAQRDATPEGIIQAVPYIKMILEAYRIPIIEVENYEADDVIGTLAIQGEKKGYDVFMVTPDKDYGQIVSDHIKMYRPSRNGGFDLWGPKEIGEHFDINGPEQVRDLLGLMGDASDNIPGCKGIGAKTASKLLKKYGDIDNIYAHIDEIRGAMKKKLIEGKEDTMMSRYLTTICTDVPVSFDDEAYKLKSIDREKMLEIFRELEFRSLGKRILGIDNLYAAQPPISQSDASTGLTQEAKENAEDYYQASLFESGEQNNQNTLFGEDDFTEVKSAATLPHTYHLVQTKEDRDRLWSKLSQANAFAFDTETNNIDALKAEIVGISFCCTAGEAYYIPLPKDRTEVIDILTPLKRLLNESKHLKIGQNLKYDLQVLGNYQIDGSGPFFDTMIAHYILFPEEKHNMDDMASRLLNYKCISYDEMIKKATKKNDITTVPLEEIREYAAEDADITFRIYEKLLPLFDNQEISNLLKLIEMPLMPVLASMEREGVKLDTKVLEKLSKEINDRLVETEAEVVKMAGKEFNVNSPKQVGEVLFEDLKLGNKPKKTKSGSYSTSEENLLKVRKEHPIVQKILDYRGDKKLLNTYIEPLPGLLHQDGRLHSSFNQCVTATGRLSSSDPNLQNIPIRTSDGSRIREAFVARSNDYCFLSADYSQIELRLMAHLSRDEALIKDFIDGEDVHRATAAKIYGVKLSEVTQDQRRKAKTANFGIIYGISVFGLSERLDIPRGEAKDIIEGYFRHYPRVRKYMDEVVEEARKKGYVQTLLGRRRYLPDINSRNKNIRSFAERNAINAPIQGTAADIIKMAMIKIYKELSARNFKTKMILQVHDELNFDVFKPELEEVKEIVREGMEHVIPDLSVPLIAEMGVGSNWLEAH